MSIETKRESGGIDMLHGPLLQKIFLVALPLAASSILQQLFNSADVAVVGRFAGSQALAAVGSNGPVINLFLNLFVGLAVGANVIIARYIGQHREEEVHEAVHTAIAVALASGVILMVMGVVAAGWILELMNTPDDVIALAAVYLRIYFLGMPFIMLYNFGAAILRSKGDTKRPLYSLIVSGVVNVALNLVLVIVFRLGVAGVAIATVTANGISAGIVVWFLMHEERMFRLEWRSIAVKKEHLGRIFLIGAPAGLQGMVFSLSNICIQTAINGFGSNASAGSSAALNFEYFSYFVISAFAQTAVTFVSQNYGAGEYRRCRKAFRCSIFLGMSICAAMCAVFLLARQYVIRFYTDDPAVIEYAVTRMMLVCTLECLTGVYEISGAALRGMGRSLFPALLTVLGSCVFRIVWIYTVFAKWHSYEVLMLVYPVSWIITGAAVLGTYEAVSRRMLRGEKETSVQTADL